MADPPQVSEGALTLLTIARENDTRGQLASNAALASSLEELATLARLCREEREAALRAHLDIEEPSPSFPVLSARVVDHVDQSIRTREDRAWSAVSDFDHGVFLAMAQTLAEVARAEGGEPSIETLRAGLGRSEPGRLQESLVANYVGNLLQDYFDACKVRIEVPGLPVDTEERLRHEDGRAIASAVFAGLDRDPGEAGPAVIGRRFKRVLEELVS